MEKRKKLIILGIVLGVLLVSGITYAILTWTSSKINIGLTSNCFTIDYTKGNDINNTSISALSESDLISNNKFTIKEGIALTYANIGIKSTCTIEGYGSLYLNVTSLSDAFSTGNSKGALKYAVLNNTSTTNTITVTSLLNQSFDIVSSGSITSVGKITLLTKQLSNTKLNKYLIVIYVDESKIANDAASASFNGTVSADANQGKAPYEGLAKLIANDTFVSNSTATNNGITYQYDTTHNLMKDIGGNIRYYGASPNNYIYFNCSDYSNQSSSTCETWRIIGVFEGKIKLIRNSIIDSYSWDNKNRTTGAESSYGKNDWTDARLMKLLNPGYESEITGGSLYYNSGSGNCYSGQSNATTTCNFTSTGIKNDITRGLISDTTYYLGGWNSSSVYPNQIYEYERETRVFTGRTTTWQGKIALPYPSDYGYAADLGKCTKQMGSYSDSTCASNNWMKSILVPNAGWLLTPNSGDSDFAWYVDQSGNVDYAIVSYAVGIAPVLSLSSKLSVKAGTGSSSEPYQLAA